MILYHCPSIFVWESMSTPVITVFILNRLIAGCASWTNTYGLLGTFRTSCVSRLLELNRAYDLLHSVAWLWLSPAS